MTIKKRPIRRRVVTPERPRGSLTSSFPMVGKLSAPIWLILDPVVGNPNAEMPLDKRQMEWFVAHLKSSAGFERDDVCIISCAPAVTSETWGLGKLINAHLKEHRDELLSLLADHKPKFIIPLGAKACQQVIGRAVQITKVRGQPIQDDNIAHGIPMLPMFSPFFAHRSPENEATFRSDMQTAGRIFNSEYDLDASVLTYEHNYRWCYDLTPLMKKRPRQISVDVESVGLKAFDPTTTLLTVQICYEEGETLVIPINYDRGKYRHHNFIPWDTIDRPKILRQLKKLLEDPRVEVTGQNFKFDWLYLWYKLGITVANYKHDTMLLAHLYDENQRINIDDLVRQHVPAMAGFNDTLNLDPEHHGKSRMDLLTPEKMLVYAGGDPDATWRVRDVLLNEVGSDAELYQTYDKVTMPAQRAFCFIELNGFAVSRAQLVKFEKMLRMVQKQERIYLLKQIPKSIKDKHRDTGVGVKVTRSAILIDWLYEHEDGMKLKPVAWTKTKLPSISSKNALPHYIADYPVIARLIDYIKNDKLLNTYAKGFHKYIFDELLRPSYKLAATVTGRSASADPNGQNFPKRGKLAKEFRKFFKAPEGWVYMSCDLSQAELRIAAMFSGDPTMLKVYADGGDIHRTTAAGTMGLTLEQFLELPDEVQSLKRFQAKAVNFGFLYGMWWVKFREYAKTDYGIDFTAEEAKEIRENFFRTYPMLEHWHRDVQELVLENGMIRTYDGRIRHLPNVFSPDESLRKMAQRQAINSPVQAIASDLGLMSLGRLLPYIRENGYDEWLKPCGFIHDAIVCLVREDKVAEGCQLVKHFMENNPLQEWFDWTPEIPILADAEIGRTLADTYEIKPEQFMDQVRSYTDIVGDELRSLRAKLGNAKDDKARDKLLQSIANVEADILMSDALPFIPKTKCRNIKTNRSNTNAARSNPTKPKKTSNRVRLSKGQGPRRNQRSKSPENETA